MRERSGREEGCLRGEDPRMTIHPDKCIIRTDMKRKTVGLGLLGTTLDGGISEALGPVASDRERCSSTRTCSSIASSFSRPPGYDALARRVVGGHRGGLAGDGGPGPHVRDAGPVGLRGGLRGAPRLRARYPLRPRPRGLPRPHHDGHARRADLPLPAHRGAPPPGAAAPDRRRRDAHAGEPGHLQHHRPRSLALRPARARFARGENATRSPCSSRASRRATRRSTR